MAMEMTVNEQPNLTGIILHVEDCGDEHADSLTFYKSRSRTVAVGRKSSSPTTQHDPERALFRCQVVSRKHAKITFTECGNVYITDLHSHHGTHLLRSGDFVSAPLIPEQPAALADGDLITFGKSVGREDCLVRPVVVRVELIFGGDCPSRVSTPSSGSIVPRESRSPLYDEDGRPRPTSGRYGVFLHSPEASSSEDGDSDIQEISPPSSPRPITLFSTNLFPPTGRLRLLQQILPPIHLAETPDPEFSGLQLVDLPIFVPQAGRLAVVEEEDMDLSSSRSSSVAHPSDILAFEEPSIIGAWPGSPSRDTASPLPNVAPFPVLNSPHEVIEISDDDRSEGRVSESSESGPVVRETPEVEIVDAMSMFAGVRSIAEVGIPVIRPASPVSDDEPVEAGQVNNPLVNIAFDPSTLEAQIANTLTDVLAIRDLRDHDEAAFSAHVEQTKSRLDAIDARVQFTQASITARNEDLSSIQTRLQGLDSIVMTLQERTILAERLEELMKEVATAKDVLQDTCALQEKTRAQMVEELDAVRALRAEAAAVVAASKTINETAQNTSILKRKREDEMDDDDESVTRPSNDAMELDVVDPSPSKRRRIMSVACTVAHTATVATFGAVAAWGALAFS